MSILKAYTHVNGLTLGFHRVRQLVIDSRGVNALIHSFASKAQFTGDADIPNASWQTPIPLSAIAGANPVNAAEEWLVSDLTSPLVSGNIDTDADELTRAKDSKKRFLASQRDALEFAGVTVPDVGVVPTDPASQRLLTGATVLAMIALSQEAPFSLPFAMKDGSVFDFGPQSLMSTAVAVGAYVSTVYVAHRAALAQVDAAETIEAVNAVNLIVGG
jgi:hypothetical protein